MKLPRFLRRLFAEPYREPHVAIVLPPEWFLPHWDERLNVPARDVRPRRDTPISIDLRSSGSHWEPVISRTSEYVTRPVNPVPDNRINELPPMPDWKRFQW